MGKINKKNKEEKIEQTTKQKISSFFLTTLNGMAYGLFATLIVGTIIKTIAQYAFSGNAEFIQFLNKLFTNASSFLTVLTGAGIGVGIALALKFDALKTIVLASVGQLAGYLSINIKNGIDFFYEGAAGAGDPLTISMSTGVFFLRITLSNNATLITTK